MHRRVGDRAESSPPTPTGRALASLPPHLRRLAVAQDYDAYTPRDHAVWRHVLRRLVRHLADRAHPSYLAGLQATGIGTERIPHLDEMNRRLEGLGWSAVCVRGFIPPAAFTELQSLRVLAIAADVRSHQHVEYTPAPDIVHESAGHAPILADPDYAAYLQKAGELGVKAIASVGDLEVFEAIRHLSVVKEDPAATPAEVRAAEERLAGASAARREPSESARASRLYWWTAEYGLVGELQAPRIYGAGLLSSIGESTHCLSPAVERVPLDLSCTEQDYDITTMQPRLFVARVLAELSGLADRMAATLSWRRGGDHGLGVAGRAGTVVHLGLEGGLEVSGIVYDVFPAPRPVAEGLSALAAVVGGPAMLSRGGKAIEGPWSLPAIVVFGRPGLPRQGRFSVELASGLRLSGRVMRGREVVELRGRLGSRELPLPPRALLVASTGLPSVAGGAADPATWDSHYGRPLAEGEAGAEARARARTAEARPPGLARLYEEVRSLREAGRPDPSRLAAIGAALRAHPDDWLLGVEVEELRAAP
jgi:phenylalanine-4-hydroxylase